jgi:MFS family permease
MLFAIAFGSMSATAGRLAVPALLPSIIETFQISDAEAGYAVTATLVAFGVAQYPGGRLSDELSRKTVLVLAAGLFLVGFAVLSVSPTFLLLLVGAAVIGVANGLYLPASLAEISELFSSQRGRAFGVNAASIQLGSAIGPGLVAVALAVGWWRLAFVPVVALFGGVFVVLHFWSSDSYDFSGVPEFDLRATIRRLTVSRQVRRTLLAFAVFGFAFQGAINFLPTFMQVTRGFSPTLANVVFAAVFLLSMVTNPFVGSIGDRFGYPLVAAGGVLVALGGLAGLTSLESTAATAASVLVLGVGLSSFWPVMDAFIMDQLPDGSMGGDFGALNTFNLAGGSLGPIYVGFVAERTGYRDAYLGLAVPIVAVGALLLMMWYPGRR